MGHRPHDTVVLPYTSSGLSANDVPPKSADPGHLPLTQETLLNSFSSREGREERFLLTLDVSGARRWLPASVGEAALPHGARCLGVPPSPSSSGPHSIAVRALAQTQPPKTGRCLQSLQKSQHSAPTSKMGTGRGRRTTGRGRTAGRAGHRPQRPEDQSVAPSTLIDRGRKLVGGTSSYGSRQAKAVEARPAVTSTTEDSPSPSWKTEPSKWEPHWRYLAGRVVKLGVPRMKQKPSWGPLSGARVKGLSLPPPQGVGRCARATCALWGLLRGNSPSTPSSL